MNKAILILGSSFAAAMMVGCSQPRPFGDLTEAEKVQFTGCVKGGIAASEIYNNKTGTIGGDIDAIIAAPGKFAEVSEKSARQCAASMSIDPRTVPGLPK